MADTAACAGTPTTGGNGGATDRYSWTQTLDEVSVRVPLPVSSTARVSGKRDLDVLLTPTRVRVALRRREGEREAAELLAGEFSQPVHAEESLWHLDDGNSVLVLLLDKADKMQWWSCVLRGDAQIDATRCAPEDSKLSDLDPETRSMVEQMMVEQRRKDGR